ncbi:hypothetical protein MCU_00975 [Bartonella elizabethae Re6043vi]|uniref:Uncharacterized protein n=2 Tax=Bartonella elizabethae TaxID=807 RepID=J1KFY1_BAREL|nr:hypothetical protein MCU_00975 [Bartonella elizabethae Re6043vi]EJF96450.1 hypothetical protein MEE_00349 [Bartonella elizabethae F9251 = ATCC 49927]VEJ39611.1 Uncharacterised protein [Bartonella elizabethae]
MAYFIGAIMKCRSIKRFFLTQWKLIVQYHFILNEGGVIPLQGRKHLNVSKLFSSF